MAARLNPKQDDRTRSAIQATKLVQRLQGFALNETDPATGQPFEMKKEQVSAALGLLKKVLPDLANVELKAEVDGRLVVEIVKFGADSSSPS